MRTNELILYKNMEYEELLLDMTFLMEHYDNEYYNQEDLKGLLFSCMNELLELSECHGFFGNLWHTFLTFLLANDENAYSTSCEITGETKGSLNLAAEHDFWIFKELFDYDFTALMRIRLHNPSRLFFMSAIFLLTIGRYTFGLSPGLHAAYIGLGIHVLVAYLDRHEVAALRPQVESAFAYVQQFPDLLRVEIDFFRFTLHYYLLLFLLCHDGTLYDGFGKHLEVRGSNFQFYIRSLFDQAFYGNHKYQF